MELGLKEKIAIVSAASKGLGFAVAKALAKEGANLVIFSKNRENIENAAEMLKKETAAEVVPVTADLYNSPSMNKVVDIALEKFGTVHILVTNAAPPPGHIDEFAEEKWREEFEQIFLSATKLIRLVLPKMIEQNWGRIINILSITVKQPIPSLTLSNSLRLALAGLAKTLTFQITGRNITINNIAPGYIMTDRVKSLLKRDTEISGKTIEEVQQEIITKIPLRRIGDPEELGNLVAFLASEKASYINGTTIPIDGGMSLFPL
ncbi:MAG: SDR family oxidoreductase [Candidatus Njordarchaeia archaeon]